MSFLFTNINAQSEKYPAFGNFSINADASSWVVRASASINGEIRLYSSKKNQFHVYAKVGVHKGYFSELFCKADNFSGKFIALSYIEGFGNHHFELSTGISNISDVIQEEIEPITFNIFNCSPIKPRSNFTVLVDMGYRYQKPGDSIIFRAYLGQLGLGIGMGYAFL